MWFSTRPTTSRRSTGDRPVHDAESRCQGLGGARRQKVARNSFIVGTTSAAYEGVAKGEFAVAVTMEYAACEYVAGGLKEIQLVYPAEGTFRSPEGMAFIKGGKNPQGARKLYEFLASKAVQTDRASACARASDAPCRCAMALLERVAFSTSSASK
jgi:hypothetical protein